MKIKSYLLAVALCGLAFTSCESKAGTGALVGGAVGVGAGAALGGGTGALIGGAVGAVSGAAIGAALDASDRRAVENESPRTMRHIDRGEQLTVNDIIALHKAGIDDRKIMDLIDKTNSSYSLSTSSIHRLERAGVSDQVVNYMMTR